MIAIYYSAKYDQIFSLYSVKVDSDEFHEFLEILSKRNDLPFPESDVMFIENDEIINRWNPLSGDQKDE